MRDFELQRPTKNSVWQVYRQNEVIDLDPPYQREGEVWSLDKKQLLIDTILNEFDVPKIYFHEVGSIKGQPATDYIYAVVDGKQRLSAIWAFIRNEFALASDFRYLEDDNVSLASLTYREIAEKYPDIKTSFDAYTLDIISIETSDVEVIEDLFSRLNEAVPLNAAEKRNAYRGPLPKIVREISDGPFFKKKIPFSNKRYRHYDLIAKFLMICDRGRVVDTKKSYIDKFFEENAKAGKTAAGKLAGCVETTISEMADTFTDKDPLLRQVGMVTALFYVFHAALETGVSTPKRKKLVKFEAARHENKETAARDLAKANYELLEFDRFAQSPNDPIAMRYRMAVLDKYLFDGELGLAKTLQPMD